jgi:hypothetical protein
LEAAGGARGCGPDCPPETDFVYREYEANGEPLPQKDRLVPCCPRCGRLADVIEIQVIHDPTFFGNAERLREVLP